MTASRTPAGDSKEDRRAAAQTSGSMDSIWGLVWNSIRYLDSPVSDVVTVVLLTLGFSALEGIGLGMLLPVLAYVERGPDALLTGGIFLGTIGKAMTAAHLPINLPALIALAVSPLLLRQAIYFWKENVKAKIQYGIQHNIRKRDLGRFLTAGMPFFIIRSQGEVSSSLLLNGARASSIPQAAIDLLTNILLLVVYTALLFSFSPLLAAVTLPLFVISAVVVQRQLHRGREFGRGIADENQNFSEAIIETFRNIRLVKMRGLEVKTASALENSSQNLSRSNVAYLRVRNLLEATAQPILILGAFSVLYFAVQNMGMHLAELGMFMLFIGRSMPILVQSNTARLSIHGAADSLHRVEALSDIARNCPDVKSGAQQFDGLKTEIELDSVSFSYGNGPNAVPVIQDLSLTIARGKTIALVGPSGAGKSTMADLICRFYEPTAGAIRINGRLIEDYDLHSLRRGIAMVSQEAVLFHTSIRDNIEIGLDAPLDDDTLSEILRKSHCDEFVRDLPEGVDTIIGERGMRLSGGQRQRLSIARALAQDPEILILDEPTSSLDSVSEAEIQASLDKLRGQITVLVIAHRLATVRNADTIIVLNRGRLAGQGTHDALMQSCAPYRELVHMQSL